MKKKYPKISNLVWAMRYMWELDRSFIYLNFMTIPVTVALPLVQAYFTKILVDGISLGQTFTQLTTLCTGFMLLIVLLHALEYYLSVKVRSWLYYPTSCFQTKLFRQNNYETDYENTEKQTYNELFGYAVADATHGGCSIEFIWQDLVKLLTQILGIATYASLLVVIDPLIFLIVAVVSGLSYFAGRWQNTYYEKHKHEWEKENRKISYLTALSDDFSSAKDIKLYHLNSWLEKMLRDYQSYVLFWNKKCSLRGVWAAILAGFMMLVQDGAAYLFLIAQLIDKTISVGDFVFYFGVVGSIAANLTGLAASLAKLNTRADKIAYYRELFDYPNTFNRGEGAPLPTGPVTIEFRDVWYRYAGAQEDTIRGLNLTIREGESIALVGVNGAGKTTLVKLLCGLYTPTRGEIFVDGRPIREYNIHQYYSLISAVFQKVSLVAYTIFEFITSADSDRPTALDDAADALRAVGLWEKIESLPNGIYTHLMKGIYDDGIDLSGGEMQKLLLARAIYKNGPILLLDEPTAALDPIAENELYLQYRALTRGKTSIYISHRFASTRFCDRILLLENGKITESGTHEELMCHGGQYAYMFGVQSKYYKEGKIDA